MSRLLKSSDPDPIYILRSGPQSVCCLKFTSLGEANEEVLVSGCENGEIQVWDLKTRRVLFKVEACKGKGILFADIIKLEGNEYFLTHSQNGCIQFWVIDGREVKKLSRMIKVYEYGYCPIAIHKEDNLYWLAYPSSGDSEFSITMLEMNCENAVYCMKADRKRGIVMHIELFCKGILILALVGYEDGSLCFWNLLSHLQIDSVKLYNDPIMCIDIDSDGSKLICGSADTSLHTILISDDLKFQSEMTHFSKTSGFACSSIRKDSRIVACGGWDGSIRVFSWKKFKPLAILKYHSKIVNSISFSLGNLIAAASKDGTISLWDVYKDS